MADFIKANLKLSLCSACHSLGRVVCAGVVILITSGGQAQNLFVSDGLHGDIFQYTPSEIRSTFAFYPSIRAPLGLAFNSAGDLFEADGGGGNINVFRNNSGTLSSSPTIYASGLYGFHGALAVNI